MFATDGRTLAPLAALALSWPACATAQDAASATESTRPPPVEFSLTQASDPGSKAKPWEQPALLSYTIDRDGPDFYNIALNAEAEFLLDQASDFRLGPSVAYNRSNATDSKTDLLELGLSTQVRHEPIDGDFLATVTGQLAYAREGIYPDRSQAPCDTDTTSEFCRKQFSEKLKGNIDFFPFISGFEDYADPSAVRKPRRGPHVRALAYSFSPRLELAHDEVLEGAIDAATGLKVTGGYTSVLAGAGLKLTPGFVDPPFELNLTGSVRQRIAASALRTDLTDRTEARMQASATYFITGSAENSWRAGISAIWTEGGDSFAGQPKASTIILAFRIGRF